MPNKRHDGKVKLQPWVWKEERDILHAYAKQTGQTKTELIQGFIATLKKKLGK